MSSLPTPAVQALEQAREWAERRDELAELEERGWRFGEGPGPRRVCVAEQGTRHLFAASVEDLLARIALTTRLRETLAIPKGEP